MKKYNPIICLGSDNSILRLVKGRWVQACAYRQSEEQPPQITATHMGLRSSSFQRCEKCGEPTRWVVLVVDRWAYWCGCDN
jgi:hypothetical protein